MTVVEAFVSLFQLAGGGITSISHIGSFLAHRIIKEPQLEMINKQTSAHNELASVP